MYNKEKIIIMCLVIVFIMIFMCFGGTLAYYSWQASEEQKTNVAFTIESDFSCAVDGGGDITSDDVKLVPTTCTDSEYAIQRTVTVTPTLLTSGLNVSMDLWLNVDLLDSGLSNSENFKYALTSSSASCEENVISAGNFNGLTQGNQVKLFENVFSNSTPLTFYLYIWLDKAETSLTTMNQNFSLSFGGVCTNESTEMFYGVYSETDNSLRFYQDDDGAITAGSTITTGESTQIVATEVYKIYENIYYSYATVPWGSHRENITKVVVEDSISPKKIDYWFSYLLNATTLDLTNLDTSQVTRMANIFKQTGYNVTGEFSIIGLSNWNVSNVTNMYAMFHNAGRNSSKFDIGDLGNWDVSKVTDMYGMFAYAGATASTWNIGDLSSWNVSNVTNMNMMFGAYNDDGSGSKATTWSVGDLSNWDVSKVTDMGFMFNGAGYSDTEWSIGDLSNWDVSKVTTMYRMFNMTGYNATTWSVGDLSNWDVSNVTNMQAMFNNAGYLSETFIIGDLSNWDVSNVTNMRAMFYMTGTNCDTFEIGGLGNWDVSNVTTMRAMFYSTGNLSETFIIGDLSNWDVSKVTDMGSMFEQAGFSATEFDIGDLDNWDVSKVTDMASMFAYTGYSATTFNIGNISGWNVFNVTSYDNFNNGLQSKITAPEWIY